MPDTPPFVDSPPAGPDAWREVWQEDRRYRPRPARFEWLLRLVRRVVGRAGEAEAERQKNFNVVLIDLLADLRRDVAALRDDLKADLAAVQHDVQQADEALAGDVAKLRELIPVAARRNDALIAALDQKIESVAVRVRDVTNAVIDRAPQTLRNDYLYRRLEDGLRGSEADIRASVAPYVELARTHAPLIDIGCGRGELLEGCRDAGVAARGFEVNERSVADLRARGFDVTLAGVPGCFDGMADASAGAVVAMHVVEHVSVGTLFALYREAARVLRGGGLLIIETPNAEAFAVTASDFWRDPTHLAPRHPAALVLLGREHGFDVEEVRAIHPFPEGNRFAGDSALVEALNEKFFGGQDLRLVLRRNAHSLP
jgi:SAM-dependent methyltransferase